MGNRKRSRPERNKGEEEEVEPEPEEEDDTTTPAQPDEGEQDGTKKARKRKRKRKKAAGEGSTTTLTSEGGVEQADGEEEEEGEEEASGLQASSSASSEGPFTAYVEGISYEATEEDVQSFFQDKGCGKVLEVRMPRYQDSGRPRGYAHLDFKKADGLNKAIQLNGQYLMGRYLKVARANDVQQPRADLSKPKPPGCRTVFVKNLPYEVSEDDVREAFTFCGKIANVRLAIWNHTKAKKGFGYVDFIKEESAEIAVKKQGSIRVGGRLVQVDFEAGKPKGSFKTVEGKNWKKTVPVKK